MLVNVSFQEQKPPQGNDSFSVSRLIGEGDPFKDGTKRLDIPDDDGQYGISSRLMGNVAMSKFAHRVPH